jgi:hypothetical protein
MKSASTSTGVGSHRRNCHRHQLSVACPDEMPITGHRFFQIAPPLSASSLSTCVADRSSAKGDSTPSCHVSGMIALEEPRTHSAQVRTTPLPSSWNGNLFESLLHQLMALVTAPKHSWEIANGFLLTSRSLFLLGSPFKLTVRRWSHGSYKPSGTTPPSSPSGAAPR